MSAQSPMLPTPKGQRNNRRHPKKTTTPYTQKATMLTTPPSSPPRNRSPGGTTDSSNNVNLFKKKNPRSAKKTPRDGPKGSPFTNGHHRTSSHGNATIPQLKDSPHYAGPTFSASPAPSALPMPSFFSKSMPETDLAPALDSENEVLEGDPDLEATPSKPKSRAQCNPQAQENKSTPLDFLFKAAVEARNAQAQRSPEARIGVQSPQTDSKALPQRSSNSVAGGMFSLEMENAGSPSFQIGPSFAPSYQDRMNALRSSNSPSQSPEDLDEGERKAKTEALKSLLLNPRPQRPSSGSPVNSQVESVKGRPSASPNVPHFATPLRTTSGPPATVSHGFSNEQGKLALGNGVHSPLSYGQNCGPQPVRGEHSALRKEIHPGTATGISNQPFHSPYFAYNQPNFSQLYGPPPQYGAPVPCLAAPPAMAAPPPRTADSNKLADDLWRALKINANSNIQSNGVQSSFA